MYIFRKFAIKNRTNFLLNTYLRKTYRIKQEKLNVDFLNSNALDSII
jgi:hypothetical protein